jgi:hypothetical protein
VFRAGAARGARQSARGADEVGGTLLAVRCSLLARRNDRDPARRRVRPGNWKLETEDYVAVTPTGSISFKPFFFNSR